MELTTKEQELFELVQSIGETANKKYSINIVKPINEEILVEYRIYHSDGYCFDICQKMNYNVETDEFIGFEYDMFSKYEGFKELTSEDAIKLIQE